MIKFRGNRVDNNEEIKGSLTVCNAYDLNDGTHKPEPVHTIICKQDIEWINDPSNKRWCFPSYEVIPESVAQYTTINDKKDVEIYGSVRINGKMSRGGDRVKGRNGFGEIEITEVRYSGGAFYPLHEGELFWKDIEVIGRQYDNKEKT